MVSAGDSLAIAALTVGVSAAVGYGIYRAVAPRGNAQSPSQMGRKWFAWTALVSSVTLLPKFFRTFDIDSFSVWMIIGIATYGGIAFCLGWAYGKIKGLKPLADAPASASSPTIATATVPPSADAHDQPATDTERRLARLDELFQRGTITKNEYDQQRNRILGDL